MLLRSLAATAVLLCSTIFAQDVLDKVAADACTCMDGVKLENNDKDAYQTKLGMCFIQSAMPYEKELKKKYDLDLNHMDEKTGEKLGMLVATRMAAHCPDMLTTIASLANDEEDSAADVEASSTLDGEVTASRTQGFVTITVRSASGRSVELLWLEFFDGADLLNNGNAQGKKGTFSYVERELFDATGGIYRKYNVLTGFATQ